LVEDVLYDTQTQKALKKSYCILLSKIWHFGKHVSHTKYTLKELSFIYKGYIYQKRSDILLLLYYIIITAFYKTIFGRLKLLERNLNTKSPRSNYMQLFTDVNKFKL